MRITVKAILFASALFMFAAPGHAIEPVFQNDGAAIRGYDPVSYFTEGKAVAGKPEHSFGHEGARWLFTSAENRALFEANPEKYAPAYGGYCAWAVANNYTAPIDPDAWSIRDGRLYLNYSKTVRARWALDKSGNIAAADRNWPGLRDGS